MDNEHQNTQLSQSQNNTSVASQPVVSGKLVLQPTAAFLEEIGNQPVPSPINPITQAPTQVAIPQPMTSPTALPVSPPKGEEYTSSSLKVSNRTSSLSLYAIVMLILSGLSLLSALGVIAVAGKGHSASQIAALLGIVKDTTLILPIVAAIIFLTSKSVKLVKALLIVMLINYLVGITNVVLLIFAARSSVSFSIAFLGSLIIPIIFLIWTWSVFSDVQSLSE